MLTHTFLILSLSLIHPQFPHQHSQNALVGATTGAAITFPAFQLRAIPQALAPGTQVSFDITVFSRRLCISVESFSFLYRRYSIHLLFLRLVFLVLIEFVIFFMNFTLELGNN